MKLNSRSAAFQALLVLLKPSNDIVPSPISVLENVIGIEQLSEQDRSLTTEITMGVLRQQQKLNELLKPHLEKAPPREVTVLLLSAIYQLYFLDRIPSHAVVNETVNIAHSSIRTRNYSNLINAVLHRFIKEDQTMDKSQPVSFSLPEWLLNRWIMQFGEDRVKEIQISLAQPQIPGYWFNFSSDDATDLFEDLVDDQAVESWSIGNDELITANPDNPPKLQLDEYSDCVLGVGLSSQIVSVLVADGTLAGGVFGGRVLDLCAGYGHKSLILRALLGSEFTFDINDTDLHKVNHTADQFKLWEFEEPKCCIIDITQDENQIKLAAQGKYDLVLVDAPCTGSGTFRRMPNKVSAFKFDNIMQAADLQSKLLINAAKLVKPGGILAYSVCSLEFEEGTQQIENFLKLSKQRWELRDIYLWEDVEFAVHKTEFGYYLLPVDNALEGFFLAILKSE